jgi:muconate cycloisomerase
VKIETIETYTVALPMRRVHVSAVGAKLRRYVIVKVTGDDGIEGFGEATVLKEWGGSHGMYFGESHKTVFHVVRDVLAPAVRGMDPLDIESIHVVMDQAIKGHFYAKAAVDIALYDLQGKLLGIPAYRLLGGKVRDRVPVCHSIGIMPPEAAAEEGSQVVQEGIKTIKLKIGYDLERDVQTLRLVRETIGDGVAITVDANQGYPSVSAAVAALRRMEPYNVMFAEQPVQGLEAMAEVARKVGIPLMHDEGAWTPQDVLRISKYYAGDIISLYTAKPGGLWPAKKVAAVAEAAGFLCNVNGSAETGVGNAANLALAGSTPVVTYACVIPVTRLEGNAPTRVAGAFYIDDVITEPFRYVDGALELPSGPGLGITVDQAKMNRYAAE